MQHTPGGWPYMGLNDYVDTTPAYSHETANKLEALVGPAPGTVIDTGDVPLVPNIGYSSGSAGCSYRVINGICYLSGLITRTAGTFPASYSTVMTLPTAARPSRATEAVPFLTRTYDAAGIVLVQADGQVRVAGGAAPGADRLALDSIRPYPVG